MDEFSKEPNTRSNQISAQEQYIALLEEQISKQRQAVQLFCDKLLVLSRDLRTQFSNFSEVTENNDSFTPPSSQAKKLKAEKTLAGKSPRAEKRVPSSKDVGTAGDKKLKAKKNVGIYDDFISDILKQHCPDIGITRKGMDFMNYLLDYYISEYGADNEKPTINEATAASSEGANPAA